MANHLDLEEQEQLDELKHFWKQYGNLITWILIAVLGVVASWNGYQYWQSRQAAQASVMFDEVEKVVRSGDLEKAERAFHDMRERFASATYTQHAALLLSRMAFDAGNAGKAKTALIWLADHGKDDGLSGLAKLRLASILIEEKAYDEALKRLESLPAAFDALASDRRGDVYILQGKHEQAKTEYQRAFSSMEEQSPYRRIVIVKLNAMGVDPEVSKVVSKAEGVS